ncbi:MAG: lipoyl(octanoyl) transferase LipB [Ignavibacteria bacterium]|jgi:lipoyl(octanoyl) transferase|nr:lipoyl(octanoyl) transferase LipB [Ignavibacteria bacterium]MCU7524630.1 lipoyl(octanoyl) transferase LipB [Ignavibacteria bacterium]
MRELVYYDLGLIDYEKAWDLQRKTFDSRRNKDVPDTLYLLEHPHTYTLGKVADRKNLISSENFLKEKGISVYDIDRGGDITYHGPGQIVGYPILDLTEWKQDTHLYLRSIEEVIILTCRDYGLHAGRIEKLTGVWIEDRKIAAIGIKVSRWITMHGFAFNVNTDLSLFQGIIPCGITDKSVTSLSKELGYDPDMNEVKEKLVNNFKRIFNYDSVLSNQENQLLLRSTGLS